MSPGQGAVLCEVVITPVRDKSEPAVSGLPHLQHLPAEAPQPRLFGDGLVRHGGHVVPRVRHQQRRLALHRDLPGGGEHSLGGQVLVIRTEKILKLES